MNRINPLYIGLLIVALLLLMFFKLTQAKEELSELKVSYNETSKIAIELSALKEVYSNKSKTKSSLSKILKNSVLRGSEIKTNITPSTFSITSKSIDLKALNYLMGKILNGAYKISSMHIKKLSDTKASLEVEIKL